MGTCPKCKLRIRKNGNHVKLGLDLVSQGLPRASRQARHRHRLGVAMHVGFVGTGKLGASPASTSGTLAREPPPHP